jgi:predicted RNA-binding Zn-ribbon protein involved in translation (DUF1610 family)
MRSHFDTMTHRFVCPNCKKPFEKILRTLQSAKVQKVACPNCGAEIDIRVSKTQGEIGKAFDLANQMDLPARDSTSAKNKKG